MIYKNLEEQFDIIIPQDFKLFQRLIEFDNPIVEYFDTKENFTFRLTKWLSFMDNEVKIDVFFDSTNLVHFWNRQIEMWGSLNYLPFGTLVVPHSGQLLYSNVQGDLGKIYYTKTGSKEPMYLAPDLFTLIDSVNIEYRDDKQNLLTSLYKNWGEDFWRVRGGKEAT